MLNKRTDIQKSHWKEEEAGDEGIKSGHKSEADNSLSMGSQGNILLVARTRLLIVGDRTENGDRNISFLR